MKNTLNSYSQNSSSVIHACEQRCFGQVQTLRRWALVLAAGMALALASTSRAQYSAPLTDIGGTAPTPGPEDISALDTSLENPPPGLNYYFDNSPPPGQTFTTSNNPNGYILTSLTVLAAGGGGGNITTTPQPYLLRIYSVDATGTNAALLATYESQINFTFLEGDWLQWTNLNFGLQSNTVYAWSFARGTTGYELLGSVSGDQYAGGQAALIPPAGGGMTFSSAADYDANMDIGLTSITTLFANPPSFTPSSAVTNGTAVTATAVAFGAAPLYYQWQTDGGGGGALTNIPNATSATLSITGLPVGVYRYDVIVTNSSYAVTSAVASLDIMYPTTGATFQDAGDTIAPLTFDISQLLGGGNNPSDGLNYYDDNGPSHGGMYTGQTFTTGTNAGFLVSVTIGTGVGGSGGTGTAQPYDLFLYAVNGSTAALMAHYTNGSFTFTYGDWLKWSGFSLPLKTNSTYAYAFGNRRNENNAYGWAGLTSTSTNTDVYPGGQICLIPAGGGPIIPGTSGKSDAAFDVGIYVGTCTPQPTSIAFSPSRTPVAGTSVTLSEAATGAPPLGYQWQTDGGGGGALTNIPSANATNLVVNTTGMPFGNYRYDVIITNTCGAATSAVSTLVVTYANTNAIIADIGASIPTPAATDISQLLAPSGTANPPGLNYYFDNGSPPGQTFTTGSNPNGYTLTTWAIKLNDNSGGLPGGGQSYVLRLYSVFGGTATLYATFTSQNNFTFVNTDWLRMSGFAVPLAASTTYAYSFSRGPGASGWCNLGNVGGNPYTDGAACTIPTAGGAISFGTDTNKPNDATFVLGLAITGYPIVPPPTFSPSNTVYAGTPVTVSAPVTGTGPFTYQWQTDGGSGGAPTNIPGAINASLAVDTTGMAGLSINYDLVAANGSGSTTGEVATLTVIAASAPILVQDIAPPAPTVFAGRTVTFGASFAGTLPIALQWQVDKGTGLTNIVGQTGATLTLANLALSDAGNYRVVASNSVGTNTSSSATLTVKPLSGEQYESAVLAANPLAYYPLNETNGSPLVYDMSSGHNGTNMGATILGVPGVPNPPWIGFSATNTALQTTNVVSSWVSAPFGTLGLNNVTFTAWIYPAGGQTNWAGLIMSRTGGAEGGLGYNDQQMLGYTWNNGTTWSYVSGLVIPSNQWSFVAMVIAPTNATLYLYNTNGLRSATNAIAQTPDVFGNNWRIGNDAASADPGRTFKGVIDEVAIYPYSLTPTQIQQLYAVGSIGIRLSIQQSGTNVILSWPAGTLMQADAVTGPWTTNAAASPYSATPTNAQKFFRVKVQ